ncbi:MAG: hypothetical protein NZ898_03220 [Myxococcota bacterium]|nr:hypothetical protein [Myxococcota bacterium]MDW8361763.1 hypothetical protein [Myxococcales bacterium]
MSHVGVVRISAPGKIVLLGEYAVREGHEALVAAIDRRVWLTARPILRDGSPPAGDPSPERAGLAPEIALALRHAERRIGRVHAALQIDTTALQRQGRKLGLGSSAAGAAVAAALPHAWAGRDVQCDEVRRLVLESAMHAHRAVSSRGSGVDVAASVLGGVLRYRRPGPDRWEAVPFDAHGGPVLRVVWTGSPVRTASMVDAVDAWAQRDSNGYRRCIEALAEATHRALAAWRSPALFDAVERHAAAMDELGRGAGVPVLDETTRRVRELARRVGGAAKPSGAGGGDVVVAFLPGDEAARAFEEACRCESLHPLRCEMGASGVRNEPPPNDGS